MGGWGSGSWSRWNKKNTVDDGLSLDINKLVRDGLIVRDYATGSLRWTNTRTGNETASIGFILEPLENGLIMRLHYTRTGRNGDKENLHYPIELQTTRALLWRAAVVVHLPLGGERTALWPAGGETLPASGWKIFRLPPLL